MQLAAGEGINIGLGELPVIRHTNPRPREKKGVPAPPSEVLEEKSCTYRWR